jgi:2-polyprenyl-3-methyl-5-hydroxy-6-metoxy-1,4-benzoquinol methylase
MDAQQNQQIQQLYDRVWDTGIQTGREDYGDLDVSLRFIEMTGRVQPSQNPAILDIGCGFGRLCHALAERGYTYVTGTDISKVAIEHGLRQFPGLDLRLGDALKLDFPDSAFDTVLSFDVIEHLPDVDRHLAEVYRVLLPRGSYLFQTPNLFSNAVYCTITYRGFGWRKYHPSLQTVWSLRQKLRGAGFTKVEFYRMPASPDKVQLVASGVRTLLNAIPWHRLSLLLQTNYYVAASKS